MSATTSAAYLGLLVFGLIWMVASGLMMVGSARARDKVPTWGWGFQFVVSSLIAAYSLWMLW